ncbi:neuromedin-S isoform X2 [Passer domesticus]|uniref:neuromedin-S isoform X2 n=1 Tax=Passer domesticus TaxID=48849 RepID=UPI0030FE95C8
MPSPPPALPWLLAACCLCALPRGSAFPQPFSRYRDGVELPPNQVRLSLELPPNQVRLSLELPPNQQLALCFSQWMEMSDQPQISSTVLDLCYSIFNSMHKNEDSHGTLGRPFFLFRVSESLCFKDSESQALLYVHR